MNDADRDAQIASLQVNVQQLHKRVRLLEKQVETLWTHPLKKLWFWVDGWPLDRVVDARERRWRPWHRR